MTDALRNASRMPKLALRPADSNYSHLAVCWMAKRPSASCECVGQAPSAAWHRTGCCVFSRWDAHRAHWRDGWRAGGVSVKFVEPCDGSRRAENGLPGADAGIAFTDPCSNAREMRKIVPQRLKPN